MDALETSAILFDTGGVLESANTSQTADPLDPGTPADPNHQLLLILEILVVA